MKFKRERGGRLDINDRDLTTECAYCGQILTVADFRRNAVIATLNLTRRKTVAICMSHYMQGGVEREKAMIALLKLCGKFGANARQLMEAPIVTL
jgi:hypothetical protein